MRRVESDYFTDAIDYTQVKVLEEFDSAPVAEARAAHGDVRVNRQIVGFKKIKFYTMENVGAGNLSMPEQEMHTTAFWLTFPESVPGALPGPVAHRETERTGRPRRTSLRTAAAFLLMCDPRDLGVAFSENISEGLKAYEPDLYLYDSYAGGIGQSAPLFQNTRKLLAHALELLRGCPCESGCPSCAGPVGEVGEHGKQAAARILGALAGE